MGFVKRISTTEKVEITERAENEAQLVYLHNIVTIAEEHKVPSCLILNIDQTPLKYIPVERQSLEMKGSKLVLTVGSTDKRSITGTLIITLSGKFLPM